MSERDRGEVKLGTALVVGVAGLVGFLAVSEFKGWTDLTDLINVPTIAVDLGSDPEEATASVDDQSYEVEIDLDISCTKRVSAAVDVEAFKNGPVGDGVFEKKVFGDFLLCSENSELNASGVEKSDPVTGEVKSVDIVISGLQVTQPRVEFLDVRNCIDGNVGESMDSINSKVEEYITKSNSGDKPSCDDGFEVTQLGGSSDLAKAKDIGIASAELALTVGTNPVDILKFADEEYRQQVSDQLAKYEKYSNATINVVVQRPDDTQSVQARLDVISQGLSASFSSVEFGTNDKGNYMYVERPDGSHATVMLDGYASLEVDELTLNNVTSGVGSGPSQAVSGD